MMNLPVQRPRRCRYFTLIEVVIATAILAVAIGVFMSAVVQVQANLINARNTRGAQHSIQQATEWFLLANPQKLTLPDGLLPPGYQASCQIEEVTDQLPDYAQNPMDGWVLVRYRIEVVDGRGESLGINEMYRMIREDDK